MHNLKDSDDGVNRSQSLAFWILCVFQGLRSVPSKEPKSRCPSLRLKTETDPVRIVDDGQSPETQGF
jgi:hypothetical protein